GRRNIRRPTQEHTELAIKQNRGLVDFIGKDLSEQAKKSGLSAAEKKVWETRAQEAVAAVQAYLKFLENVLKKPHIAGGFRSMRLGPERYARKFALEIQSNASAEEIYRSARREKERILQKMTPLAERLWPKYFPGREKPANSLRMIRQVIDKIALKHTAPEKFVDTVRAQIPRLTEFVNT